jgi:hypothetical protein
MILPNVRASFGRAEAALVLGMLSQGDGRLRDRQEARLREEGFDSLLDDPRTLNGLMATGGVANVPAHLAFYILVRHALLEVGIGDRALADYLAALLVDFGKQDRARRVEPGDDEQFHYLVDIVQAMSDADGRRAFLLKAHLGNYALWLSGLFPDYVTARVQRRGAPGLEYYEEMGVTGYRLAADSREATPYGLDALYRTCADAFPLLRHALNHIADRHLFPRFGDPVDRLLRQLADEVRHNAGSN